MAEPLAYGFIDHEHVTEELITTIGEQAIYESVIESARYHSEQIQNILSQLVTVSATYKELVKVPNTADLQPITDFTQPDPVRFLGQYDQGYPMFRAGIGMGMNRVSRATMTVGEANRQTLEMLKADARWMKRHILAAMLQNTSFTYTDETYGALTVQPLANGDSVKYQKMDGAYETANHYLAQANTIGDGNDNPFPGIYNLLMDYDANRMGQVITYIHDDQRDDIEDLTGYVPISDSAIILSTATDQLNVASIPDPGFGDEIIGRVNKNWICRCSAIPSGYMISVVIGGSMPVVHQRVMPVASLQGFFQEQANPDGNLSKVSLIRYAGFGVRNRIGAVCTRIGNGVYAAPTGYAAPLAG